MTANRRTAFTLVELLVAMVVAATLSAALLVALYGAQQEARDARTRAQIAKLNELLARQWETYSTRNVSVVYNNAFLAAPGPTPREQSLARLLALRDLMRMEMPDRITDLIKGYPNNPTPNGVTTVSWSAGKQSSLRSEPHLFRSYLRRINSTLANANQWSPEFQGAECLYLIIATMRDEDSSGLDFFREAEIGDVDNDLMPELLDGWGRPIEFLRWAPGFPSLIQSVDRTVQPDHLDLLKVDPAWNLDVNNTNIPATWKARSGDIPAPGYLLFPLIYSAGIDGEYWLYTDYPPPSTNMFDYTNTTQMRMVLDPYETIGTGVNGEPLFIGTPLPAAPPTPPSLVGEQFHMDNITNHLIEVR